VSKGLEGGFTLVEALAPETGITRRWRIKAGPVANTRLVTVRVVDVRARQYGSTIDLTTIIRQW
jgi:hypothetical protein